MRSGIQYGIKITYILFCKASYSRFYEFPGALIIISLKYKVGLQINFWKICQEIDFSIFARSQRENTSFNFQSYLKFPKYISEK